MSTVAFLRGNAAWLGAGALLTFLSSFGQTYFISLFSGEIREGFGLSHGDWGLIYSVGTMISALVMVWAGGLTDRYRTAQLGAVVLAGLAAACIAMALNQWVGFLFVVVFLLRFFGQGMASHAAVVAMSRWFVATRGRALAVCTLGFTIGEALLPLGVVFALGFLDWRLIWLAGAVLCLGSVPLLLRMLRTERHPHHMVEENQSTGMNGEHWLRAAVLRHPLFWFMVPALLGPSAFNTAFFFHQVHYAELRGITHLALVALFPLYTAVSVAAMLVSGWAIDRFGVARILSFYQVPMIVCFVAFSMGTGIGPVVVGLVFLALTSGANTTLPNAFWAEFFGTRHLGAIKAMATAIMVLGSALGPAVTGLLIDAGLDLDRQFLGVALFFAGATACMAIGVSRYRNALRTTWPI